MTVLRPRRIVHRGRVEAVGLLFDESLVGAEEVRRRVLALWRPGAEIARLDETWLLLHLDRPLWIDAEGAVGTPLVKVGAGSHAGGASSLLATAPLDEDEISELGRGGESVVIVRGGVACVLDRSTMRREDPADWIDAGDWRVISLRPLGPLPATPRLAAPSPPADARAVLGSSVPPEHPARDEVIEALKAHGSMDGRGEGWAGASTAGDSWRFRLARWLTRTDSGSPPARREAGAPLRLSRRFRAWMSHLLMASGLGQVLGRAQQRYLGRMMALFERGDFEEALRHAIPLGGGADPASAATLGVPSPRSELVLRSHRSVASSTIHLPPELMATLQRQYRQAFEILEARGELERAAFVLAELLHAETEAVAFLERHGRLHQAAELAEARSLPPGLVVRQWFVAGEVDRAIVVARRTGAFADAVSRLERQGHPEAPRLRLLWAESLAAAGDFLPAVKAAWPVLEARRLVGRWIELGLTAGGPAAAVLLAYRIAMTTPETRSETAERVRALLARDDSDATAEQSAFLTALLRVEPNGETRSIARLATRAALPLATSGHVSTQTLHGLVQLAGDGPLRADLRGLMPGAGRNRRQEPGESLRSWTVPTSDRGARPVHAVARLPVGRLLVAMGEAGVELLTRDGRRVAHFDQPAHQLVVSHQGTRALALARRGEAWKVARIDLVTLRADAWCDLRLDHFAEDYDGSLWFVAADDALLAIDCRSRGPAEVLWRIPDLPGRVLAMNSSADVCRFVVHGELRQRWRLALPHLTLRARDDLAYATDHPLLTAVSATGDVAVVEQVEGEERLWISVFREAGGPTRWPSSGGLGPPVELRFLTDRTLVGAHLGSEGVHLRAWSQEKAEETWGFLGGAGAVSIRVSEGRVVIGDDGGRLLVFDLRSGERETDVRL